MSKILAGKKADIPPGQLHKISVDGKDILVINLDGNYFAMDDTCTHAGASLSEGSIDGDVITCGWHGAKFNCKNGKLTKFPAKINDVKSYNVTVDADEVFIEE